MKSHFIGVLLDDLPIGGRVGTISEMQYLNPPLYLICWNQESRSPGTVVE